MPVNLNCKHNKKLIIQIVKTKLVAYKNNKNNIAKCADKNCKDNKKYCKMC